MEHKLSEIIIRVCKSLNDLDVQYLIIGGSAVALHGYFRMSRLPSGEESGKFDLDFYYNPTYTNYFNLLKALQSLGENVSEFWEEKTPEPLRSYFKFQYEQYTLDFLPSTGTELKFRNVFDRCEWIEIQDIKIPFMNLDDLIFIKEKQGRQKDIEDVLVLKSIKENRGY